jgi:DNA (cytosine-5)-methyltransferase 1
VKTFDEIIVDNFAGGGGASTGIEQAIGRSVDIAINHDPAAIAMHKANHPGTKHYCESVWDVDPREAANGRPIGLAWFSPDCKHFSKAKGGKPVDKSIRGLAWIVLKWAGRVRPRVIILENVEEFVGWGPIRKGKPIKSKKGQTFAKWKSQLESLGYRVEHRELRACDYGAPTIRKRFFMVARCDGRPIVWPKPTHGDPNRLDVIGGKLLPWRTAAEIIDWSLPCPSIFERKKPLAENTMRRIAKGIQKFVIDNPQPFVIKVNHVGEDFRGQSLDEPIQTITAKNGWGIVTPFIAQTGQTKFSGDNRQYDLNQPLTTVVSKAEHLLVTPFITKFRTGSTGSEVKEPLHTITAGESKIHPGGSGHAMGLVMPVIVREFGCSIGHSVDDPLGTITAGGGGHSKLVATFLSKYHGAKSENDSRGSSPDEPIRTVDTSNRFSLITSHLIKLWGTGDDMNIGSDINAPIPTVTATLHIGEVRAFLMKYYGRDIGQAMDEPLHTVTSKSRFGLVTIQGQDYQIVDIGMRMLEPHELFAAQGFPESYIIDRDCDGKRYSKAAQVARCGNAVPPPLAEALVKSNLSEMCSLNKEKAS